MSAVLSRLLSDLSIAVLESTGGRSFALVSDIPAWLDALWPTARSHGEALEPGETFLFLDDFIDRAIAHWEAGREEPLVSGLWTETRADGAEILLEATARCIEGRPLLLIHIPPEQQTRGIFQQAREQRLAYEHLLDEINKREILLHCIVHDLSNPLAGIRGSLKLMEQESMVSPDGDELLRISLSQTEKMQRSIRGILEAFSVDARPLMPSIVAADVAPDILLCAHQVAASMAATAALRGVAIQVEAATSAGDTWRVAGEAERLERVFFNLVANALRYATEGETITLRLIAEDAYIHASVEDQGPGVSDAMASALFTRFARGDDRPGQAGLGLYFCRITVEQWGGQIGYRPAAGGGACFWFRVPRPAQGLTLNVKR
ncbi:MAG: HAMP domain-containing sensor histidine kinase [Rhodothermales bacterium]|nr:HAMP domain-containing sensor histidine kinase [Rhodothermales bacterium]